MDKFLSRKLIVTVLYGALVALNKWAGLNLSEDAMLGLAGVVATYLAGQTYIDSKEAK